MAILNRSTLKQKISDFINRVAPFTDPLIQKSEDLEVRGDLADSVIFRDSNVGAISGPGANVSLDFASNDEYNIDTSASIPAAFSISLANLRNNSVGKINITKKTGDVFTFANGQVVPFNNTVGQTGTVTLAFNVFKSGSAYFVVPLYNYTKESQVLTKVLPIGAWNVAGTGFINVAHGVVDFKKIVEVNCLLINDSQTFQSSFLEANIIQGESVSPHGSIDVTQSNISLKDRSTNLNTSEWDGTASNRGYITIKYLP